MYKYRPENAVPAGRDIRDWAEEHGLRQGDLAARLGLSEKGLSQIVTGKAPLSRATAQRLGLVTGISASYWNRRELVYREHLDRLGTPSLDAEQADWVACFDTNELKKHGAITATGRDKPLQCRELLSFFAVASPAAWERVWQKPQAAFRRSRRLQATPHMASAWLRFGEREITTWPSFYSQHDLERSLERLRQLTREPDPKAAARALHSHLWEAGVSLVFVPAFRRVPIAAATRWFNGRPVIQMSDRHKTDDHFWFSFFHEVGHVLESPTIDTLEGTESIEIERQADAFAAQVLIPGALPRLRRLSDIEEYAEGVGVSAGIAVGRLQHEGKIRRDVGNRLKSKVSDLVRELTVLQRVAAQP
ncbi:MAG: XRE family transcriptional regulator [Candidatus Nanopelagicales bacterium]|nr:XRE family transcriptional regulator [Candidatus Nanopelagicales bacterium]MDZ4248990.1 XRE family transcriptional regulator [Candidatus Nanopelagicales bacterium]